MAGTQWYRADESTPVGAGENTLFISVPKGNLVNISAQNETHICAITVELAKKLESVNTMPLIWRKSTKAAKAVVWNGRVRVDWNQRVKATFSNCIALDLLHLVCGVEED